MKPGDCFDIVLSGDHNSSRIILISDVSGRKYLYNINKGTKVDPVILLDVNPKKIFNDYYVMYLCRRAINEDKEYILPTHTTKHSLTLAMHQKVYMVERKFFEKFPDNPDFVRRVEQIKKLEESVYGEITDLKNKK